MSPRGWSDVDLVDQLLDYGDGRLTDWEVEFAESLYRRLTCYGYPLTAGQRAAVEEIIGRLGETIDPDDDEEDEEL